MGELYEYCRKHHFKNLSPRRVNEKELRWEKHLREVWASWPLCTLRRPDAQEWVTDEEAKRADGKGLSQLSECRTDMHGYFQEAIKSGFFEYANPFQALAFIKPQGRQRTTIQSRDFNAVLTVAYMLVEAKLVAKWQIDAWAVSLLSGLRHGEVFALRHSSIDRDRKAILVDRAVAHRRRALNDDGVPVGDVLPIALWYVKGGSRQNPKSRYVPITDQLASVLDRMPSQPAGFVFASENGGLKQPKRCQDTFTNFRKRMNEVAKGSENRSSAMNAVIEEVRERDLKLPDVFDRIQYRDSRNSFLSYAAEVGVPDPTCMALAGHAGTTTLFRNYQDLTTTAFEQARTKLSDGWKLTAF